jgi:hypothetical protein
VDDSKAVEQLNAVLGHVLLHVRVSRHPLLTAWDAFGEILRALTVINCLWLMPGY